jgi:hypothetical protein
MWRIVTQAESFSFVGLSTAKEQTILSSAIFASRGQPMAGRAVNSCKKLHTNQ